MKKCELCEADLPTPLDEYGESLIYPICQKCFYEGKDVSLDGKIADEIEELESANRDIEEEIDGHEDEIRDLEAQIRKNDERLRVLYHKKQNPKETE